MGGIFGGVSKQVIVWQNVIYAIFICFAVAFVGNKEFAVLYFPVEVHGKSCSGAFGGAGAVLIKIKCTLRKLLEVLALKSGGNIPFLHWACNVH